jgi:Na+-driven multidrug efflux pump
MQLANSLQNTILNNALITYGGDMGLSAMGIIGSLATLMFLPILGISQGAQPIIGFNYGAVQFNRVRETWRKAVIVGTASALTCTAVLLIWAPQIVGLFSNNNTDLTNLTVHAMRVFFIMFPIAGFQIISSQYFQAVGKPVQSTILGLSRQLLLLIPLLLILPHFWGIEGVWRTPPIADILSTAITAFFIIREMKHMREQALLKASDLL